MQRYVTDWASLCRAYQSSYDVAKGDPGRYAQMSVHAVASLKKFCSQATAEQRLGAFLEHLFEQRAVETPEA